MTGSYPTFTGTATAADGGAAANVAIVYPTTGSGIKTLTLTYISAQAEVCGFFGCTNNSSSTTQRVGISGFTFC